MSIYKLDECGATHTIYAMNPEDVRRCVYHELHYNMGLSDEEIELEGEEPRELPPTEELTILFDGGPAIKLTAGEWNAICDAFIDSPSGYIYMACSEF
jgi:hypothetical protein